MKDGSDKETQKKGERTQANGKLLRCDRSQPIMSPGGNRWLATNKENLIIQQAFKLSKARETSSNRK
jgi:hypothetical protein